MKKLINKNNIIIGVIILILCAGLSTIFILGNKKDSSLDKHFSNDVNESNETIAKTTEEVSETTVDAEVDKTTITKNNDNDNKNIPSTSGIRVQTTSGGVTTKKNKSEGTTVKTSSPQTSKTNITSTSQTIKTQSQKNDEYRNQILTKYNVFVGYKDEIDGVYKNSYAKPRKIYDDEVISYNLTKIDDALKKYPKSFFSEIKRKWKPISIYLVDYINGYAGGVTDNNNSSTLVILIVATHSPKSSILENTVHHEMMHALDCYFTSKGIYSSYTLEQSIAKYNPEGFSYGVQDNKYVYLLDNPYYFVSKYAKSAYNEDRAETFSNLMYRSYAPAYLKAGQPINEKAKVITSQINQNFTSASSGNNRWDKLVAH